jgi:hypothetical protein
MQAGDYDLTPALAALQCGKITVEDIQAAKTIAPKSKRK